MRRVLEREGIIERVVIDGDPEPPQAGAVCVGKLK